MQHFRQHIAFYNQPIRLTEEQQQEPIIVIREFFQNFHLVEIRQKLWNWFETAITTEYGLFEEATDRSGLMQFYSQLEELVEAAYLIDQQQRKKSGKKRNKKSQK